MPDVGRVSGWTSWTSSGMWGGGDFGRRRGAGGQVHLGSGLPAGRAGFGRGYGAGGQVGNRHHMMDSECFSFYFCLICWLCRRWTFCCMRCSALLAAMWEVGSFLPSLLGLQMMDGLCIFELRGVIAIGFIWAGRGVARAAGVGFVWALVFQVAMCGCGLRLWPGLAVTGLLFLRFGAGGACFVSHVVGGGIPVCWKRLGCLSGFCIQFYTIDLQILSCFGHVLREWHPGGRPDAR